MKTLNNRKKKYCESGAKKGEMEKYASDAQRKARAKKKNPGRGGNK